MTMKKILQKINTLTEQIEFGFLTKEESFFHLRELRNEVTNKFGEGSTEFMECIESLIDAHSIACNL